MHALEAMRRVWKSTNKKKKNENILQFLITRSSFRFNFQCNENENDIGRDM